MASHPSVWVWPATRPISRFSATRLPATTMAQAELAPTGKLCRLPQSQFDLHGRHLQHDPVCRSVRWLGRDPGRGRCGELLGLRRLGRRLWTPVRLRQRRWHHQLHERDDQRRPCRQWGRRAGLEIHQRAGPGLALGHLLQGDHRSAPHGRDERRPRGRERAAPEQRHVGHDLVGGLHASWAAAISSGPIGETGPFGFGSTRREQQAYTPSRTGCRPVVHGGSSFSSPGTIMTILQRSHPVRRSFLVLAALAAFAASGCGRGTGSITGEVKYNGQPLPIGDIAFLSQEGDQQVRHADIIDGKYSIPSIQAGQAKVVGDNVAAIAKKAPQRIRLPASPEQPTPGCESHPHPQAVWRPGPVGPDLRGPGRLANERL